MNKITTTVEQAKELLELGIDPNTASMYWTHFKVKDEAGNMKSASALHVLSSRGISLFEDLKAFQRDFVSFTPAWTLVDLIEFLPDKITKNGQKYTLSIGKDEISYIYINTQRIVPVACLCNFEGNLIDAAVEAIKAVKKLMS